MLALMEKKIDSMLDKLTKAYVKALSEKYELSECEIFGFLFDKPMEVYPPQGVIYINQPTTPPRVEKTTRVPSAPKKRKNTGEEDAGDAAGKKMGVVRPKKLFED